MKIKLFISVLAIFLAASNLLHAQNENAGAVAKAYYTALDAGNTAEFDKLCSADFMASAPFLPTAVPLGAWKEIGAGFKAAFPDMKHEVLDWFSDGRKVAITGMASGTNTGSFMGNPPTGNKFKLPFIALFELTSDLKIKAVVVQFDQKAMETQLMAGIDPNAKTKANILAYFTALDAGDVAKIAGFCAPNVIQYFPGEAAPLGLSDIQKRALGFNAGFPDAKRVIQEIVVAGNWVTIRGVFTGTNTGMFRGKPATGRSVSIPHLALFRLNAEGLIEEAYVEFDTKLVDTQLNGSAGSGK